MRYKFHVRQGRASSLAKSRIVQEISFADIMLRMTRMQDAAFLAANPFSPHSSSYFGARMESASLLEPSQRGEASGGAQASSRITGAQASSAVFNLMPSLGAPFSIAGLVTQQRQPHPLASKIYNHRVLRWFVNCGIVLQFLLCVLQMDAEHSARLCRNEALASQIDNFLSCAWCACGFLYGGCYMLGVIWRVLC